MSDFEKTDSGSSKTTPMQAGNIKKGGHLMIKGRPCKVIDVSTSKTGKHGHAKAHFVANDIFTNKRYEELCPTSHNIDVPIIKRTDFTLIDIQDDDYVTMLDENGNSREDLKLPPNNDLRNNIKQLFENNGEVEVTIISAIGEEMIVSCK